MVASATYEVLGSIRRSGKQVFFTKKKISVVARSLEVSGAIPPYLGKHVKPLVNQRILVTVRHLYPEKFSKIPKLPKSKVYALS